MVALTRTPVDVASLSDAGVVAASLVVQTDAAGLRDAGVDRGARLTGRSTVALSDAVVRTVGRSRAVADLFAAVDDVLVQVAYAVSIDDEVGGVDFFTGFGWALEIDDELLILDSEPRNYEVLIG